MAITKYYDEATGTWKKPSTITGSEYVLPVASSTTLGGVKPSAKTSDMTQEVGVDAEGKLYALKAGDNITVLDTQAEYDALSEDEKANGNYLVKEGEVSGGGASSADELTYDNTESGLEADNVQDAIDEIDLMLIDTEETISITSADVRDADTLGGKYTSDDLDAMPKSQEVEEVTVDTPDIDADTLGGLYDADDITAIDGKIGNLSSLTTTSKTNTVSAINELNNSLTYSSGDVITYRTDNDLYLPTITNSGNTHVYFNIFVPKPITNISSVSITYTNCTLRKYDGTLVTVSSVDFVGVVNNVITFRIPATTMGARAMGLVSFSGLKITFS